MGFLCKYMIYITQKPDLKPHCSMIGNDRLVGVLLVILGTTTMLYFTVWFLLLPFFDPEHRIHDLFPSVQLGLVLAVSSGTLFFGSLGIYGYLHRVGRKIT
ncbi:dolichol phosphate-mannose biosynthesis regulatory protein-like isoform X2 [Tachypleus tridentatus]|uniref:dolichol phosphate-mannose biosynthesis regulatory protein-like isoform X2 n=1 Tax=Tachypleus tridentatus TaxID=6853 RepID=UPI003FCF66DC